MSLADEFDQDLSGLPAVSRPRSRDIPRGASTDDPGVATSFLEMKVDILARHLRAALTELDDLRGRPRVEG